MKIIEKNAFDNAYPEPPENFHKVVTDTLDSLEETKVIKLNKRRRIIRVAVACAIVASLGAFTVAATATNFFGLFSERVGNYGLHVGVEQSSSGSDSENHIRIDAAYIPKGYSLSGNNPTHCLYRLNDKDNSDKDERFSIIAYKEENYDETYSNVIESKESKCNGNKVIYMTFKWAENEDKLFYGAVIYFYEDGYVVYANNSNKSELEKIVSGISLKEDTEYEERMKKQEETEKEAAKTRIDISGNQLDDVIEKTEGKSFTKKISQMFTDEDEKQYENNANISIKIKDIREMTNDNGLDQNSFKGATGYNGRKYGVKDEYFNSDGTLKTKYIRKGYQKKSEDDYDSLGEMIKTDMTRHFYIVTLELSADDDIEDLYHILQFEGIRTTDENDNYFAMTDYSIYWSHSLSTGEARCVYEEGIDENSRLSKGQKKTVKIGLIVDDDILDKTYVEIGLADNLKVWNAEKTIITRDITSYCLKLF